MDDNVDWSSLTEEFFMRKLTQFLFSPRGARYKTQFKFSSSLECGSGSSDPRVLVSQVDRNIIKKWNDYTCIEKRA